MLDGENLFSNKAHFHRLLSRKTYEMQMFHMSSLKMGLDQAVLNGVEGGSSEVSVVSILFPFFLFQSPYSYALLNRQHSPKTK